MPKHGKEIAIYMQQELINLIDEVVESDKEAYKSRSQFICGCVARRLRYLGKMPSSELTINRGEE